jgi:hypothetical protein
VCFAKHTLNKHNLGRTIFLQQLHRNKEKKKTLPSEAEGEGEGNSAGTDWRMLSSSSFQSLLPLFLVFFFSVLSCNGLLLGFFVFVPL